MDPTTIETIVRLRLARLGLVLRHRPDADELASDGPQRQPRLGRRHGRRDRRDRRAAAGRAVRGRRRGLQHDRLGDHPRRHRARRRPRAVHRADREDDRDAAAGVAVQRGRRRRGSPHRDRRLPRPDVRARRPDRRRDRPRHRDRLDHVHRLADRVRQADGPVDHAVAAGHHPGRPDRHRGAGADRGRRRDLPLGGQPQRPGHVPDPRRVADLRRDDDAADRRRRHAGRDLAAQLVHRLRSRWPASCSATTS